MNTKSPRFLPFQHNTPNTHQPRHPEKKNAQKTMIGWNQTYPRIRFYALALALLSSLNSQAQNLSIACDTTRLVSNLESPWDIEPLGLDQILLTERTGKASIFDATTNTLTELLTFEAVATEGQGGLLGAAIHPQYPEVSDLFFAITYYDDDWNILLRVDRVHVDAASLNVLEIETIIEGIETGPSSIGGRLLIDQNLHLWLTCGVSDNNALAQDGAAPNGKTLRYHLDGSIPAENPTPGSSIFTLGHRNPQGICQTSAGTIFTSEHGAFTNDEVNSILPGRNYGWPLTSGPCNSTNQSICDEFNVKEPLAWWTPNIAPSGMTSFGDALSPEIESGLLVSSLAGKSLRLLVLSSTEAAIDEEYVLLNDWVGRIRDVATLPSGRTFFITSNTDLFGEPTEDDDKLYEVTFAITVDVFDPEVNPEIRCWITNNRLFFEGIVPGEQTDWELLNTLGQPLNRGRLYSDGAENITQRLLPGTYILRFESSRHIYSQKLTVLP